MGRRYQSLADEERRRDIHKARMERNDEEQRRYWRDRRDQQEEKDYQRGLHGREMERQDMLDWRDWANEVTDRKEKTLLENEERKRRKKKSRYEDQAVELGLEDRRSKMAYEQQKRDLEMQQMRKLAKFERLRMGLMNGSQDSLNALSEYMMEFGPRDSKTGARGLVSFKPVDGGVAARFPGQDYEVMNQQQFKSFVTAIDPLYERSKKSNFKEARERAKLAMDYAKERSELGEVNFDEALEEGLQKFGGGMGTGGGGKASGTGGGDGTGFSLTREAHAGGGIPENTQQRADGRKVFNKKTGEYMIVPQGATGMTPDGKFVYNRPGEAIVTDPGTAPEKYQALAYGANEAKSRVDQEANREPPVVGLHGNRMSNDRGQNPTRETPDSYYAPHRYAPQDDERYEEQYPEYRPHPQMVDGGGFITNETTGETAMIGLDPRSRYVDENEERRYARR